VAQRTIQYEGRTIILDDAATPPFLSIDGRVIEVSGRAPRFMTRSLAHAFFTSLADLAKTLVKSHVV